MAEQRDNRPSRVIVTDFDMSIGSMIALMFKAAVAQLIVALVVGAVLGAGVSALVVLGGVMAAGR